MAVLYEAGWRVLLQGATGAYGLAQLHAMREAGTPLAGVVAPGRGGAAIEGLPSFDRMAEAVAATGAEVSIIYVPASGVRDALVDAADAGIRLAIVAAEFVPVHDALWALGYARERGMWVVGPNSLGMMVPGQALLGSIATGFTAPGRVGVIGRSGTLTLTGTRLLTRFGCGQSAITHMGGDSVVGRNPHEYLARFLDDPGTDIVAYLGEIGGGKEYAMLDLIAARLKPVVSLIVGRHAPPGKQMGHAGALVEGTRETAGAKRAALAEAGAVIADNPEHLAQLVAGMLVPA